MKKRILLLILLVGTALLFAGCAMRTVEEMYALPKRSEEFNHLQSAIDSAMEGLTYSAPISGENRQTVQAADLDGNGVEEYLVFATGNQEKPLQVLIFSQKSDGTCYLAEVIESNGTAFEQVDYVEFDEKPGCELVIGRQVSDRVLRSVSVYTFSGGGAKQMLSVGYSKYLTCDLDQNGRSELLVLRPGEAEAERGMAVLYNFRNGQIERSVETELSEEPSRVRRMTCGKLQDGTGAVYVASSAGEGAIVTDVFALKDGRFTNISFAGDSDTSIRTLRNFSVYPEDIDSDGIVEIPALITMKEVSNWQGDERKFLLRWYALDLNGRETDKLYSFHDYLGGWYMRLSGQWASRVSVEQGENTYTFFVWDESYQVATALFTVYVFTGADRDEEAVRDGRFALYRTEGVAYAAKLKQSALMYEITEEDLINNFCLIRQDWRTGETEG